MSWIDVFAQGLMLGGLYALFAAGLSLVFGIMRLVNLAHGDMIILGAYLIWLLANGLGISPVVALVLGMPVMFLFGWLLQTAVFNRVLGEDILPPLLVTFGLSVMIQNLLLAGFTADSRKIALGPIETASLSLGHISLGVMPLLTFGSAIAVIVLLNWLNAKTAIGRAFRATSDDVTTVQLMGIDPKRIFALATGVAMMVTLLAAFYLGTRSNFDPSLGPARLIYAFQAVIIGGLGSLWGTLIGGVVIGLAQAFGATLNPEWQILAGHVAFVAILMLRPRGLFPRAYD